MERERQGKNIVIAVLLVTVLCMSAAFAAFTNIELRVNGTANLPNAQWSVKFTDTELVGSSIGTKPEFTNNTVTYTIDLQENTTYEFNATITNAGTYDAKLTTLTNSSIPTALSSLVTYTVDGITEGETIVAGDTATVHVKLSMGEISSDALLEAVQANPTLSLTLVAEFEQA